jgi:hypothetical protein
MPGNNSYGMQCAEFSALVAAALDGALDAAQGAAFAAHRAACPACQALYAETRSGLEWLQALKTEPLEPPARLMTAILNATSRAGQTTLRSRPGWWQRLCAVPLLAPVLAGVRQPRFAMAFAMAFFSISMLLNISGLGLSNLTELRSGSIYRAFGTAQGKVLKYYDNLRFVYEIESRVRELKRAVPDESPSGQPEPRRQPPAKDGRPGAPGASRTPRDGEAGTLASFGKNATDLQVRENRRWL